MEDNKPMDSFLIDKEKQMEVMAKDIKTLWYMVIFLAVCWAVTLVILSGLVDDLIAYMGEAL